MRAFLPFALMACVSCVSCADGPSLRDDDDDDDERPAPLVCGDAIVGLDLVVGEGRTLLMGEIHGTNEMPGFVGELVCQSALARHAATLGLEIPRANQAPIDAYVASAGGAADRDALFASTTFWAQNTDGRASVAMLALLDRVRDIRSHGAVVDVLAFDVDSVESAAQRDAGMAERILEKRAADPAHMIVTLSGNIHSRTIVGISFDPELTPMGFHVKAALPDVVTLNNVHGGGTAWVNFGDGPGVNDLAASSSSVPAGTIALTPTSDGAHDGVYSVGPVSAALPAAAE